MDFKKDYLDKLEHANDPIIVIEYSEKLIHHKSDNVELYVRTIYSLHEMLVEGEYSDSQHDILARILKSLFDISSKMFSNSSEYLFFIGKILYIAEWYFGLDDDLKPMEERRAFKMQKKAYEMEPDNILFKWGYLFSLNDRRAAKLAQLIILDDYDTINWLKSKGIAGSYILEALEQSSKNDGIENV